MLNQDCTPSGSKSKTGHFVRVLSTLMLIRWYRRRQILCQLSVMRTKYQRGKAATDTGSLENIKMAKSMGNIALQKFVIKLGDSIY